MSSESSVSSWLSELRSGQVEAVQSLWDRFFKRLSEVAQRRLSNISGRIAEGEDVAASVLASIWGAAVDGRLSKVQNVDELWWLLLAATRWRCVDQARKANALKNGGGQFISSIHENPEAAYQLLVSVEPDPQYIVGFEDELERLLGILDPLQRQIAVLRLEGYSLPEIAERMKISLSSTQRKMKLVRETWACELDHGTIE